MTTQEENEPRFEVGAIIRYGHGPTALMEITSVTKAAGLWRYYGDQYFGGAVGAYEGSCQLASEEEVAMWAVRTKCGVEGCEVETSKGSKLCPPHSREEWHRQNALATSTVTPESGDRFMVVANRERALELAHDLLGGRVTLHGPVPSETVQCLAQAVLDYAAEFGDHTQRGLVTVAREKAEEAALMPELRMKYLGAVALVGRCGPYMRGRNEGDDMLDAIAECVADASEFTGIPAKRVGDLFELRPELQFADEGSEPDAD